MKRDSTGICAATSAPVRYQSIRVVTAKVCLLCGIPHNRHSFAVATLLDWHRDGGDVAARLPLLSAYLGHAGPAGTYYYLHAAPELLAEAARRLGPGPGARQ
jgi:integrase